jgi:alkylation response protein AidB-like acyl-CoA dehydrogenase
MTQEFDGTNPKIARSPLARPIRLLSRFGGSQWADRLGLLEPTQKLLFRGARRSVQVGEALRRQFQSRRLSDKPERMPSPKTEDVFDLTPTEDQQLTRDTMRRFADEVLRPAAEAADDAGTAPPAILKQSQELGIMLLAIPEALGGAGEERSPISTVLIAEELARGDAGLALAILSPLAVVQALVDWGDADQQGKYLPAFTGDEFVPAAMAVVEPQPLFDPLQLRTSARQDGNGYALHGVKTMVPLGESADLFLVAANLLGVGPRLFLVERATKGLKVEPDPCMGLRSAGLCRLRLDDVRLPAGALIGEPGRDGFDFNHVIDRARIAWCALTVGTCQAVVDYTIPYCNERIAFGEPITNRQSVAFLLADMALEIDAMRLLLLRAASLAEQGLDFRRAAYLARVLCADKGMKIGSDGVQLLGGHGFVKDHPVERWYRHLRGVGIAEGTLLV